MPRRTWSAAVGVVSLLGISVSSATAQPAAPPSDDGNTFTPMFRAEPGAIAESHGVAQRDGPKLYLKAKNRTVILQDVEDCDALPDDCHHYIYRRHDLAHRGFIVVIAEYESVKTLWIDDVSGTTTTIGGEPYFSPDSTRFVVVEAWDCCSFDGLQVWSATGPALEWEHGGLFENNRAYFTFRRWLDNGRIELETEVLTPIANLPGIKESFGIILSLKDGRWTIERQTGP